MGGLGCTGLWLLEKDANGESDFLRMYRLDRYVGHRSVFAVGPGLDNHCTLCRFEFVYLVLVPAEDDREPQARLSQCLIARHALQQDLQDLGLIVEGFRVWGFGARGPAFKARQPPLTPTDEFEQTRHHACRLMLMARFEIGLKERK